MKLAVRFDIDLSIPDLERDLATAVSLEPWVYKPGKAGKYRGWSAIALHSPGGESGLDAVTKNVSEWEADLCRPTDVATHCPCFMGIMNRFDSPRLRVRLMRLEPGGEIGTHRDRLYGWSMPFLRLHVPICSNAGVETVIGSRPLRMTPGELWCLETTVDHYVRNAGDSDRVHLVLDFVNTAELRMALEKLEWPQVLES